jgi:hypothetical protein
VKRKHGNALKNQRVHHLYEILDAEENNDVFKYGICGYPIGKDGYSKRIRQQLKLYNAVANCVRFFARILVTGIQGRGKARQLEDEYIADYEAKHGRKPRGNRD